MQMRRSDNYRGAQAGEVIRLPEAVPTHESSYPPPGSMRSKVRCGRSWSAAPPAKGSSDDLVLRQPGSSVDSGALTPYPALDLELQAEWEFVCSLLDASHLTCLYPVPPLAPGAQGAGRSTLPWLWPCGGQAGRPVGPNTRLRRNPPCGRVRRAPTLVDGGRAEDSLSARIAFVR